MTNIGLDIEGPAVRGHQAFFGLDIMDKVDWKDWRRSRLLRILCYWDNWEGTIRKQNKGQFRGLNIVQREDDVLAMLKVKWHGKYLIAYQSGSDMVDALGMLTYGMIEGTLKFHPDKYKPSDT